MSNLTFWAMSAISFGLSAVNCGQHKFNDIVGMGFLGFVGWCVLSVFVNLWVWFNNKVKLQNKALCADCSVVSDDMIVKNT